MIPSRDNNNNHVNNNINQQVNNSNTLHHSNSTTSNTNHNMNLNTMQTRSLNSLFGIQPTDSSSMQYSQSNNHMLARSNNMYPHHHVHGNNSLTLPNTQNTFHTTHQTTNQQHILPERSNVSDTMQEIQQKLLKELCPEQLFQLYMVLEQLPNSHQQHARTFATPSSTNDIGITTSQNDMDHNNNISRILFNVLQNNTGSSELAGENTFSSTTNNPNVGSSTCASQSTVYQPTTSTPIGSSNMPNNIQVRSHSPSSIVNQSISPISNIPSVVSKTCLKKHSFVSSSDSSSNRDDVPRISSSGIKKKSLHNNLSPEAALTCNFSVHTVESFKTEQLRIQSLPKRPRGRPRKPGSIPRRRRKQQTKEQEKKDTGSCSSDNETSDGSSGQSTNTAEPNH